MKMKRSISFVAAALVVLVVSTSAPAAPGDIHTVAGDGSAGFAEQGLPATSSMLDDPRGVATDAAGNIYIADSGNNRVRKVDTAGLITTIAGTGVAGLTGDGGPGTLANLNHPGHLAVDSAGNVYIADTSNSRIRKLTSAGIITTVAGSSNILLGDGGLATSARLSQPTGIALDTVGNLYVADNGNNRIRKVDTAGIITTVAGNGGQGFSGDGGFATSAALNRPWGVAIDPVGNIVFTDSNNHRIRQVTLGLFINTIAGSAGGFSGDGGPAATARFLNPRGISVDAAGGVYIADSFNWRVRKITAGIVTTIAGGGSTLGDGGQATLARVVVPSGVDIASSGELFIAQGQNRIRQVDTAGIITTVAGNGTAGFSGDGDDALTSSLNFPYDIDVYSNGNLYISDTYNNRIRKVTPAGVMTTVAGNGTAGFSGDGGPATAAALDHPDGIALDSAGNIYVAVSNRIRRISTSGMITTIAGTGTSSFGGDGGPATSAFLSYPGDVDVDSTGNIYIADSNNHRIRKVSPAGIITTVAGDGTYSYSGDGVPAVATSLFWPDRLHISPSDTLFISDRGHHRIRKVDQAGIISTVVGTGSAGFYGDGGQASAAQIDTPEGLAVDASGNLYFGDTYNFRIRKVDPTGVISTIAGVGSGGFSGDGGPATAANITWANGVALGSANLYFTDTGNHRVRRVEL